MNFKTRFNKGLTNEFIPLENVYLKLGFNDFTNGHTITTIFLPGMFYNAVSILCKRACQVPESFGKAYTLELTSYKQDVIQIVVESEKDPAKLILMKGNSFLYLATKIKLVVRYYGY